jgi:hypothetical protein
MSNPCALTLQLSACGEAVSPSLSVVICVYICVLLSVSLLLVLCKYCMPLKKQIVPPKQGKS